MSVKARVAPSPTGFLHVGNAQSALYNWLFARKNSGEFRLRIEDTDRERSTKEYEKSILDALEWLDLKWDGDVIHQSTRNTVYKEYLDRLIAAGSVVPEDFDEAHKAEILKEGKKASDRVYILKNDITKDPISFADIIRGPISVERKQVGDLVIARVPDKNNHGDIVYLYNFTVVVDDADMGITHVIRGEDHISNTSKQLLIYEALGLTPPQFAHLPLLLGPDRSKLSKRHGGTAVTDYKKDYLPEALVNFLGILSYTFSKEIITKEEMVAEFDLSKVHKSSAVFDVQKLNWLNAQYIRRLNPAEFKKAAKMPEIPDAAVPLITERLERLSDAIGFSYLWTEPNYPKESLLWKTSSFEEVITSLNAVLAFLKSAEWTKDALTSGLEHLAVETGNRGLIFWPFRVALSGKDKSPGPIDIAIAVGKEATLARVKTALALI